MATNSCWHFPRVYIKTYSFSYINNDLSNRLKGIAKLFAGNISTFIIVKDQNKIGKDLATELLLISKWAFKWNMLFNPDLTKPAQEVVFSSKKENCSHPNIFFNYVLVEKPF